MRSLLLLNFVVQITVIYGGNMIPINCEKFLFDQKNIKFELITPNSSFVPPNSPFVTPNSPFVTPNSSFTFDLNVNPKDLVNFGFDTKKQTKILIHGYKSVGPDFCFCPQFYTVYDPNEFNLICLDWGAYSVNVLYYWNGPIPKRTYYIGPIISEIFVNRVLVRDLKYDPNLIHIIGWSAGAQLAGQIGRAAKEKGSEIGRITGLDPARPGYKGHKRLNKHDAKVMLL